jgi:hypothetical protein
MTTLGSSVAQQSDLVCQSQSSVGKGQAIDRRTVVAEPDRNLAARRLAHLARRPHRVSAPGSVDRGLVDVRGVRGRRRCAYGWTQVSASSRYEARQDDAPETVEAEVGVTAGVAACSEAATGAAVSGSENLPNVAYSAAQRRSVDRDSTQRQVQDLVFVANMGLTGNLVDLGKVGPDLVIDRVEVER